MLDMETKLKLAIQEALSKIGASVEIKDIVIEHSKDKAHGDYATTVAMQMARVLRKSPRDIASSLVENLNKDGIEKVEIAGPGFINFFMKNESLASIIKTIVDQGEDYGNSKEKKEGKINVEFVSANPTGDLHLGHARGAALGDVICRLYKKAGYDVTREYYVNDAGNQINNLALSIQARYHQECGEVDFPFPEDGYHGKDLIELAKFLKETQGVEINPEWRFIVQAKRIHEYKRQLLNVMRIIYLCNKIRENPDMQITPQVFFFAGKAASGYEMAKRIIQLINCSDI